MCRLTETQQWKSKYLKTIDKLILILKGAAFLFFMTWRRFSMNQTYTACYYLGSSKGRLSILPPKLIAIIIKPEAKCLLITGLRL